MPAHRSAKRLVLALTSCGTDVDSTIPSSALQLEERAQHHGQLVRRVLRIGADPELIGEELAVEQPEDGLRVADVDGEQHRGRARAERR